MSVQQTDQPWDFVCNPDNESMCANLLRDDSPLVPEEEEQAPPEGLEHFVLVSSRSGGHQCPDRG